MKKIIKTSKTPARKYGIQCLRCGQNLFSEHRHDFKACICDSCYIDGGDDYCRIGGHYDDWVQIYRTPTGRIKIVPMEIV